jgi:RNA polymerase sigma-70 factor (ECF subfamily)
MSDGGGSDGRLVARFRNGDREAFAAIYRERHAGVFRFAHYMTGDRDAAAEITQQTFVWLVDHADAFDPERGELGAFLCGVALKMVHRRERDGRRWAPLSDAAGVAAAGSADGADEIHLAALRRAIIGLPESYRAAVVLCGLEEKSYEEAAGILGCPVGTVRSRMHRARALLARRLRKEVGTWRLTAMK